MGGPGGPRPDVPWAEAAAAGRWSLRARLFALLAALLAALLGAGMWAVHAEAREASQDLYDESLRQTGELLVQLAAHEFEEHGPSLGETLLKFETQAGPHQLQYQIWSEARRRAYRTAQAPEQPYLPLGHPGYGWAQLGGESWRAYSLRSEDGAIELQIAESQRYRNELPREIFISMAGWMALLLLVGLPLIAWAVQGSVAGLKRVAREVGERPASDLRPVSPGDLPREVAPLIGALNRWLDKLRELLENERRFTADAAHELRTPLAAIRLNAQLMQAASTPEALQEGASDLLAGVDRSSRLIEQLLALARLDAGGAPQRQLVPVDLGALAGAQLAEHARLAERRGTRLEVRAGAAWVQGDEGLLAVMLRNLVDNAIRYGGPGGTVTVETRATATGTELSVADTGPGIAPDERERVFERFRRLEGTGEFGSGLGLSIVRKVADIHGATIEVGSGPGGRGACFTVRFASVAAPARQCA